MFKKKRIDDEELDRDEDDVEEEDEQMTQELPPLPQQRRPQPSNKVTKEQIGFMLEGHMGEMIRLWNLYKQLRD